MERSDTPALGAVTLSPEWLSTHPQALSPAALRAYLELASAAERSRDASAKRLDASFGDGAAERLAESFDELEDAGLIEVIELNERRVLHLPCRSPDGPHLASPCLPSVREALEVQAQMSQEVLDCSNRDDDETLRAEVFERHPALAVEYQVYKDNQDDDSPRWRLWLELSRFLIQDFETRFGALRTTHGELFRESASQALRHKLGVIDAVTQEVFEQRERIFPEVGDDWLISVTDDAFMSHPLIRALAERYEVGPAQIFVNTLELLAQRGFVVAELDPEDCLADLLLPTTTGLTRSEERLLFLRPEDMASNLDTDQTRERVKRAAEKYARYLMRRGCEVLLLFVKRDSIRAIDELLESIAMRVNESLDLVPNHDDESLVTVETVLEIYNELRERDEGEADA